MRPVLVINPRSDAPFEDFVRERLAQNGMSAPSELESRIRERFPSAVVRERMLANEPIAVWYVYRDGHWTPG